MVLAGSLIICITGIEISVFEYWNVDLNLVRACGRLATCSHAGFLLSLYFDPEDGGDMFLRDVG
jgi:hypothetical protein